MAIRFQDGLNVKRNEELVLNNQDS